MFQTLRHQYLAIIWTIFILIICNYPLCGIKGTSRFFEGFDKLAHTGFFFVLTVFLFSGKIRQQSSYQYRIITIFKILVITISLGGLIELMQWQFFTYRTAEWWDFFADLVGVGMGIFSYVFLHRFGSNENKV